MKRRKERGGGEKREEGGTWYELSLAKVQKRSM